jgi:hypothetical protein
MAHKKIIHEAIKNGAIIALRLSDVDFLEYNNYAKCVYCRIYIHDESTDDNGDCPICHRIREEMPDIHQLGMMPHERAVYEQEREDAATYWRQRIG